MPPVLRHLDVRLVTPRLTLAPIADTDVDDVWPYASDPAFPRHMTWAAHRSRDETHEWVHATAKELSSGRGVTWAVRAGDAFVGVIGLDSLAYQFRAWRIDRAELGYWMAPPQQARGFCTEAARAVLAFAFGPAALRKVTVGCHEPNLASRRVIEKLGFRLVGIEREHWGRDHDPDGAWIDHRAYEMTIGEHRAIIGA